MSAATASSDEILILGDFSEFLVVDRQGAFVARNRHVVGANQGPTATTGFVFWWRTGADVVDANAFRMLRC